MRAWLVLLLIAPAFVGCIGSDDDPVDRQQAAPSAPELPGNVARYAPGGNASPLPPGVPLEGLVGEIVNNLTGFQGAEPTMGITGSGAVFGTAGDQLIRSTDRGASWQVVNEIGEEVEGTPADTAYRSWDPWMHLDPVTDTIYFDPMFPPLACTELQVSTDDGDTWEQRPPACHPPPMDHQKLFTAKPGPDAAPQAGALHETVLYQCYNQLADTTCAVSYDNGLTWPVAQPVADQLTGPCGGINGPGAGSPSGVAVVPITSGCEEVTLAYTTDSGQSWQLMDTPDGPGLSSIDPEVMFDDEGNLYVIWRGDDHQQYLARTPDLGETWAGPWNINPPDVKTTMFHALSTGANGTVAMSFYGTDDTDEDPDEAPDGTRWNLYTVVTRDGLSDEPTFTSYQVTTDDDPVQIGRICTAGISCDGGRNLLEFIDTAIHPDGTFYTIYTDGCAGDCAMAANDTAQSDGREIAWARLDGVDMLSPPPTVEAAANATNASQDDAPEDRGNETSTDEDETRLVESSTRPLSARDAAPAR